MKLYNTSYIDYPTEISERNSYEKDRNRTKRLGLNIFSNSIICPYSSNENEGLAGEVILSNGYVAIGTNSHKDYSIVQHFELIPSVEREDDEIIYLGSTPLCWGHYITDGLSKLWFFYTDEGRQLLQQGVRVCITSCSKDVPQVPYSYQQIIDLLGLPIKLELIRKVTHYQRVYVPANSLFLEGGTRYYTTEQAQTIEKIIGSAIFSQKEDIVFDKVYLSRTRLVKKNAEFGEKDLEKVFKKAGYKIIYPEQHSFVEQVNMLQHVKSLVATEGSIAHNACFCRPGTEVIILRKAFYTNDHQYVINQMRNLNVTYIDVHLSLFTNDQLNLGPFFLYDNNNLVSFFKERFGLVIANSFSERRFMRFANLCLHRRDFYDRIKSDLPQYYYDKLQEELEKRKSFKNHYRDLLGEMPSGFSSILKRAYNHFSR